MGWPALGCAKGLEAGLTVGLETVWSKKRILTVYLNIAEFGDGVFAWKRRRSAILIKPASRLSMSEAAAIGGGAPESFTF